MAKAGLSWALNGGRMVPVLARAVLLCLGRAGTLPSLLTWEVKSQWPYLACGSTWQFTACSVSPIVGKGLPSPQDQNLPPSGSSRIPTFSLPPSRGGWLNVEAFTPLHILGANPALPVQREKRAPLDGPQSAGWWAEFLPVLSLRCHSWCPSVPSPRLRPELGSLRHLYQLASSGRAWLRWPKELTEQSERLALGCQASGFQGQGPREDCFPEEGGCGSRRNIQIPSLSLVTGPGLPPLHHSSFMRSWVCSLTPPSPPPRLRLRDREKSSHLRFPKFCQREPLEAGFGVLLMCLSILL